MTKCHETTPDEALKAYKNKLTKLVNMIYMYETSYNMLFGEIRCHSKRYALTSNHSCKTIPGHELWTIFIAIGASSEKLEAVKTFELELAVSFS